MWQFMFAFPAPGMGLQQLPAAPHCSHRRRSLYGQEKLGWEGAWGGTTMGVFLHSFLPVDKYQPTEVLKADVELVPSADLPPIRSVDVVCGRRGQAASAPPYWHPSHPTAAAIPAQGWD